MAEALSSPPAAPVAATAPSATPASSSPKVQVTGQTRLAGEKATDGKPSSKAAALDRLGKSAGVADNDRTPSPAAQQKTPEQMKAERKQAYFDAKKAANGTATKEPIKESTLEPTEDDPKPADTTTTPAPKTAGEFPDVESAKSMKSGELSRHYKNVKTKLDAVIKEYEDFKTKSGNDPEKSKLQETLKQREDRLKEYEDTLRYTNFEQSDEYKNQYWKPYEEAYQSGRQMVTELRVKEVKDELGEITQQKRAATAEDFDRIALMDNTGDAAELAEQLFGPTQAAEVMRERRKVRELNNAKEAAKDKYKKEGGEIMAKRQEVWQTQQREVAKTYETEIKTAIEKHPEWFGEVDGDETANTALAKGFALADQAFSGKAKNADGSERQMTPQEMAKLHAAIRNKAGAFDKLVYQLNQARKELAEHKEKLKGFEASEPRDGEPAGKGNEGVERVPAGKAGIGARMSKFF